MKNNKASIQVFLALGLMCINAVAQTGTFTAKDGTTLQVKLNDADPDHARHASVNLGLYGMDGIKFVAANYYLPKVFFINASVGTANFMVDGNVFLLNTKKEKNVIHMAKMTGGYHTIKYLVRIPVKKRRSIGPHVGFGSTNFSRGDNSINEAPFSAKYAILGLTYFKSRSTDMEVSDLHEGGTRAFKLHLITRINADVVMYFDRKLVNQEAGDLKTIDDYSRKLGLRIYYDGRNSWYSRSGRVGFSYLFGLGYNADKAQDYTIFGGVGIFYAFL